jgi:3-oxoacyl-[acyl-carrier protein] reductase
MKLDLEHKHVLITGGSKGIGLASARTFLAEGARVTLVARNAAQLEAAKASLVQSGASEAAIAILAADLSQSAERHRVHEAVRDVDVLINNAGAIPGGGLLDLSMEAWEQAWALKVMGYIHLTQLTLADMKQRKSGIICNIIGSAGRNPRYDYVCGATGNAALMAFTSAIGGKSVDWGVRVFGINPSPTKTDRMITLNKAKAKEMFGDENRWQDVPADRPLGRMIEPEEIANLAAFLASNACGYVSGTVIDVDGGLSFRG